MELGDEPECSEGLRSIKNDELNGFTWILDSLQPTVWGVTNKSYILIVCSDFILDVVTGIEDFIKH